MCGITALISNNGDNIIFDLYESLYHLQHRGQDAFGLSFMNNNNNNSLEHIKRKSLLSSTNINN
jgi:glutamine phosphoribosylpyrophosphate amidotransferase